MIEIAIWLFVAVTGTGIALALLSAILNVLTTILNALTARRS